MERSTAGHMGARVLLRTLAEALRGGLRPPLLGRWSAPAIRLVGLSRRLSRRPALAFTSPLGPTRRQCDSGLCGPRAARCRASSGPKMKGWPHVRHVRTSSKGRMQAEHRSIRLASGRADCVNQRAVNRLEKLLRGPDVVKLAARSGLAACLGGHRKPSIHGHLKTGHWFGGQRDVDEGSKRRVRAPG